MFNKISLKDKKVIILFIISFTILVSLSLILKKVFIYSSDLSFHAYRIIGIKEAFLDHQIIPKIYPYANNGFGYATPLFYCDIFLYPFAILNYLGLPFLLVYRLMLLCIILATVIVTFKLSKKVFKKSYSPYLATILYLGSNYYLADIYDRGAIGEIIALIFIPFVLYNLYQLFIKEANNYLYLGLSYAFLAMSHLISLVLYSILLFIFFVIYLIHNFKDKKKIINIIINILKAAIMAILVSAWYLLPMLEQLSSQAFIASNLGSIYDVIISPLNSLFNIFLFNDPSIDIFTMMGIGILLFLQIIYLFIKKNKIINYLLIISLLLILCTLGIIPIFRLKIFAFLQFAFRTNLLIMPLMVISSIYILENTKYYKILIIILSFISLINIISVQFMPYYIFKDDKYYSDINISREKMYDYTNLINYKDYNEKELIGAEYLPKTEIVNYLKLNPTIKLMYNHEYTNEIWDYERSFSKISFRYNSDKEEILMFPLTYYKGYEVKRCKLDNSECIRIEALNDPDYKMLSFKTNKGEYLYKCSYKGTVIQDISLGLSVITSLTIIYKLNRKRKTKWIEN